jgi:uncharacterized protein YbjT (DUF2867 family)
MEVVVAGGHGKVALRLLRLLADRGDRARGLIRNPDHAPDLEAIGAEAVLCDLEGQDSIAAEVNGADAVVFAAGAGPGSGPERKRTVDYGGVVKLIEAAKENGISRYVIVSSIRADRPDSWSEEMRPYFQAKADADRELEASGLDYTIVRPGFLSDDPGTGRIRAAESLDEGGPIPRDDVAATLLATLDAPNTVGKGFDVIGGDTPVDEAVCAIQPSRDG